MSPRSDGGPAFAVARDDLSAAFFDAAEHGVLLIRACSMCEALFLPQERRCTRDGTLLDWRPATGSGALVSWAVDHAPPLDPLLAAPDGRTSVVGIVEIDGGLWLNAALIDADPSSLEEGVVLQVQFVRPGGGEPVPAFSPA